MTPERIEEIERWNESIIGSCEGTHLIKEWTRELLAAARELASAKKTIAELSHLLGQFVAIASSSPTRTARIPSSLMEKSRSALSAKGPDEQS